MNRRNFLQKAGLGTSLLVSGTFPARAFARPEIKKLTILHTNDMHSRIEPFPMDGGKNQGLGGVARRASLVSKIRAEEPNVLLLDCGDIFQGTPYFNFFGGELEFKLMSQMQYDAATLGNHDFDAGLDGLLKQLPHAQFPFLVCNYDFSDTIMNGQTKPYQVFEKDGIRIGILGVGIQLEGLVPQKLYGATRYHDPLKEANRYADLLRHEEKCDYVICLSHLGYQYGSTKVSDMVLAKESTNIDLILGGHTHTFMDAPQRVANRADKEVLVHQAGWAGILLGRLDIYFEKNRKNRCVTCQNLVVKD